MIRDALLPEFDQEMASTRKVLERCPEDKFGWKPHAKSFSMASLATHIANMTGWMVDTIDKDSFDVAPPGAPPYKEEPAASRAELLALFDKNAAAGGGAWAGGRRNHFQHASYCVHPQLRHEPHHPPPRATDRVSTIERCACTGDLRSIGG
jgi:hypothetical protein